MGLWQIRRGRYATELLDAVARATAEATRRRHREATTTHLLWALFADPAVAACLAAIPVDPNAARDALAEELAALPSAGVLSFRPPTRTFDPLLAVAAKIEMERGRDELTTTMLAGRLFASSEGERREAKLAKVGFTCASFLEVVAHGGKPAVAAPLAGPVNVVLLDDPFTTMDHVVDTLRVVFGIDSEAEAKRLMLRVHRAGRAVIATLDGPEAHRKIADVHARAAAERLPLRAVAEPAGDQLR